MSRPTFDLRRDIIKPLPSQTLALDSMYKYEYLLFGGAAGPGKSYLLRWALVELLIYWLSRKGLKNVRVGLFCENYPALKDRHISKIKREFPSWLGEIKDSQEDGLCYILRPCYGGGQIALRNLDDPAKYASSEFAAIAVDELTKNERQVFDDLRFRKRWPGIEHSPFISASNPGSKGHAWVRKLWIDRDFTGDDSNLSAEDFKFIPARLGENPFLPSSYIDTLHSLPPSMRKAMEDGSWDLFVGQYFSEWNRDLHVCRPFTISPTWKRLISIDYGYEKPSAVQWWAIDHDNHWWLYRELYATRMTYPVLGREIMERTPIDEPIHQAIADPAIWGDKPRNGETVGLSGGAQLAEIFDKRDIPLMRANHDRIQGWQACRKLMMLYPLPDGKVGSRLHIFDTCPQFIRTVPSLVHDDVRVEDLDTHGEDHHADAWRYAVNTQAELDKVEAYANSYTGAISQIPSNSGFTFAPQ